MEKILLTFAVDDLRHRQIELVARGQGWQTRRVERIEYGKTLGELCGSAAAPTQTGAAYFGPELPAEMVVFAGFKKGELDLLLAGWKAAQIPTVARKAVLTPTNAGWTPPDLCEELGREHAYMNGAK